MARGKSPQPQHAGNRYGLYNPVRPSWEINLTLNVKSDPVYSTPVFDLIAVRQAVFYEEKYPTARCTNTNCG
jgi:hypothetical protein